MEEQIPDDLKALGAKSLSAPMVQPPPEVPDDLSHLGAKPIAPEGTTGPMNFAIVNGQRIELPPEGILSKEGFLGSRINQLMGNEPGILNPDPTQNPLIGKSFLPDTQAEPGLLGTIRHGLYKNIVQPLFSPLGILGTAADMNAPQEPIGMDSFRANNALSKLGNESGDIQLPTQAQLPLESPAPVQEAIQPQEVIQPQPQQSLIPQRTQLPAELEDKVVDAINETTPLRKQQEAIYTSEKAARAAKAEGITATGKEAYIQRGAALSGEYPKVEYTGLNLSEDEVNQLHDVINTDPRLGVFEKKRTGDALEKILHGQVPQDNELDLLGEVFGPKIINAVKDRRSLIQKGLSLVGKASDFSKTMVTAGHFTAPFRQGVGLITHSSWWGAWDDMARSILSKGGSEVTDNMIRNDPNYELALQSGVNFTKLSENPTLREDAIRSNLAERLPLGVGAFIRAGNRGYNAFLNTARIGTFSSMVDDASLAAQSIQDPKLRMISDPKTNKALASYIANYVNAASGRGDLGSLEKYSTELNAVLFSPRLQAARIQLVQQALSPNTPYLVRKEAIKSLGAIAGLGSTIASLGKWGGAQVSTNPTSADFAKVKIGDNVRIDPWAGYQQDVVLLTRLTNQMIQSIAATAGQNPKNYAGPSFTSSTTGKSKSLGDYNAPTMLSTFGDFASNRMSPVAKLAYDWFTNHKIRKGQYSFQLNNEAANMVTPILVKTIYDLYQEDPSLIPYLGPPAAVGIPVEVYGKK